MAGIVGVRVDDFIFTEIADTNDSNNIYVGVAIIESDTAQANWRIMKIVTSGGVVQVLYADGNREFDNIWDNRTTLNYS